MSRFTAAFAVLCLMGPPVSAHAQSPAPISASAPTVVRDDGLAAEYYPADPAKAARGAVVVLGGSEGGLGGARAVARRLAADGLDALAVSYFGEPGQPPKLDLVPIEPVGRAIAWLKAGPNAGEPVAVVGVSKGAELALLVASRDNRIKAVVAAVPTHVLWQGIDQTGGPTGASWTAEGRSLPYVPYNMSNGFQGVYRLYADSLPTASPEAEIAVERIAGPILLVSSDDDGLWPSADMAERIVARLKARGFRHGVTHLNYVGAGHAVFGPPLGAMAPQQAARLVSLGGTAEGVSAARADVWPKTVAFLKQVLAD